MVGDIENVNSLPVAASVLVHCLENVMLVVGDKRLVSAVMLSCRKANLCYDVVHCVLRLPPSLVHLFAARLPGARYQIECVGRKVPVTS